MARQQRPDLMVLCTTGYPGNAILHGGMLDPGMNLLPKPSSRRGFRERWTDLPADIAKVPSTAE